MKKVYAILLAVATAAFMFTACQKPSNKPSGNSDQSGQKPGDDTPVEEDDAIIKIDGDFSDWKALGDIPAAYLPEGCSKVSVLALKVTSDDKNLYVYFEQELVEGQSVSPFDLFLNTDGDDETGASTYLWDSAGWDYLIESEIGLLGSATSVRDMDDMAIYKFIGPDGADGWDDPDETDENDAPYQERLDDTGFATSAGVVEGGIAKVELAVERAPFGKMASSIKVGILLYEGDSWQDNGVLPQAENGGLETMLEVKL